VPIKDIIDAWFPVVQRYVLLFGGLGGVYYETVIDHVDRPGLLILFAGMMGLSSIAEGALGFHVPHFGEPPASQPPTHRRGRNP
jgi:hypothetical protein